MKECCFPIPIQCELYSNIILLENIDCNLVLSKLEHVVERVTRQHQADERD